MPVKNKQDALKSLEGYDVKIPSPFFFSTYLRRIGFIVLSVLKAKSTERIIYTRSVEVSLLASLLSIPNVIELHSPLTERPFYFPKLLNIALRSPYTLKVISISEALKDMVDHIYALEKDRVIVLPDGADVKIKKVELNKDLKKVGYIGHLYKGRGIELILELAKHFRDLEFHIVGGELSDIEHWKNHASSNVIFYGHLSHKEAGEVRHKMDLLLAPYQTKTLTRAGINSTSWMSPLKVFEYMASGIPFISSDLPVLREVLNEENCTLVTADDMQAWKISIQKMKDDYHLRVMLASQALKDMHTKFSWNNRAKKIIRELQKQ